MLEDNKSSVCHFTPSVLLFTEPDVAGKHLVSPEVGCAVCWHSRRAAIGYATITVDLKPDIEKPEFEV